MRHEVQWAAPTPLWGEAAASADGATRGAMRRPAILRFASDNFMDEFHAVLEHAPARLGEFVARPETWRAPAPAPGPVERGPEFVGKLNRLRLAARGKLEQVSGLTPAKVLAAGGALKTVGAPDTSGASGALALATAAAARETLKLYQPAHQRFYLVAACLVCRLPGLPDRALDTAREERVGYVLRRLYRTTNAAGQPTGPVEEYGFVVTPHGSGWQKVAQASSLVENEEVLPLFAVNFTEEDGRRRRLFAGMIPVGRREAYMGAGTYTPATNGTSAPNSTKKTARKIHFRTLVTEPWKNLLRTVNDAAKTLASAREADTTDLKKESRTSAQVLSWYILLDFAKYLRQYLPGVWDAVRAGSKGGLTAGSPQEKLYDALDGMKPSGDLKTVVRAGTSYTPAQFASSMLDALKRMGKADANDKLFWEEKLDDVETPYNRQASPIDPNWPDFLFPLADLEADSQKTEPLPPQDIGSAPTGEEEGGDGLPTAGLPPALAAKQALVDKLVALVTRALPADSAAAVPPPPAASRPVLDTREGTFQLRCVYERPFCGPLDPPLLSEPSAQFQLAGFFDPDAPARPIRIALPIDTSPAGLRKFDKNTAFMISDQLCGQMQRLRGITFADLVLSVLPWPFHKDLSVGSPEIGPCKDAGLSLGMICTLSIPIITICALILLFVIVLLLDIIFKWLPFFIFCFPLPGFKGKKA
jgi:hypothetical protein